MRKKVIWIWLPALAMVLLRIGSTSAQINSDNYRKPTQTIKYVNGYKIVKGERPFIDLDKVPNDAYEQGKIFIKIKSGEQKIVSELEAYSKAEGIVQTGMNQFDKLNKSYRITSYKPLLSDVYQLDPVSKNHSARHEAWELNLWYEATFDSNANVKKVVKDFLDIEGVEVAEPIYKKIRIEPVESAPIVINNAFKASTNDPLYADNQWSLNNTGQIIFSVKSTAGIDIKIEDAWNIETGNPNVIVSVHDGGIDFAHPDLAGNMWPNIGPQGQSTIGDNHGTHVAGTIAAVTNNNIGVAGIAGGDGNENGVRLMSLDIFNGNLSTYNGYVYAANNGASISQNSWGYLNPGVYNNPDLDGIDYFVANGGGPALVDGGIVIFAAGNNNDSDAWYPAYYSPTMAVASHTNIGIKSSFSNYGTWVDITAPGSSIASTFVKTPEGSGYGWMSGTSMACPHVSGVAALIVSKHYGNITLTQLWDALLEGVDDIYKSNPNFYGRLGTGRTNAYKALVSAEDRYKPRVSTLNIANISTSTATCIGKVTKDGGFNVTARGIVWSTSANPTLEENLGFTIEGDGLGEFTSDLTNLELNTQYYVRAYASNSQGTSYGIDLAFYTPNGLKFSIVDQNKNPIPYAEVIIEEETQTTSNSGETVFYRLYGTYEYKVTASGYRPTGGNVTVDDSENTINLMLIGELADAPIVEGENHACRGSEIIYSITNSPSGFWEVEGGSLIGDPSSNSIISKWTDTSGSAIIRYRVVDDEGYQTTFEQLVSINLTRTLTSSEKPKIHVKGSIPILICTVADLEYKWFRNGFLIDGETSQHYAPRDQAGRYQVQIIDQFQCPNTSSETITTGISQNDDIISTFPNPTKGDFTLSIEGHNFGEGLLVVTNSYGKVMHQEKLYKYDFNFEKNISIPSLSQGIYIVRIQIGNSIPLSTKVTVF